MPQHIHQIYIICQAGFSDDLNVMEFHTETACNLESYSLVFALQSEQLTLKVVSLAITNTFLELQKGHALIIKSTSQ